MASEKILVIVPTYNEAENIGTLIEGIIVANTKIPKFTLDVLVVDDDSPDNTADVVGKYQKKFPNIHLLRGSKAGLGKAYQRGFAHGIEMGGYEAFVMMDADYSHDPAYLPDLIEEFSAGADYVIGSRYIKGGEVAASWPLKRRLISRFANFFARTMLDLSGDVRDITGGFRVLRVAALKAVEPEHMKANGYVFLVNLLHGFSKLGYRIVEVPIIFKDREKGVSKMRLGDIVEFGYLTYHLNPQSRVRRFIRFGFVGASGTLVNIGTLVLLVRLFSLHPIVAGALAIEVSIISNFFLNHYFTFRASITTPRSSRRDDALALLGKLIRYNFIGLGGAGLSFTVFYTLFHLGIHYIFADIAGIIVAMGWNYIMSVRFVWRMVDE